MPKFQKRSKQKRRWRGLPWDHQTYPMKETRPAFERFTDWYANGLSFDQLAEKYNVKWVSVERESRSNEWRDRLQCFDRFEGAPKRCSTEKRESAGTAHSYLHPITPSAAECIEEKRADDSFDARHNIDPPVYEAKDRAVMDNLKGQIALVTDSYGKTTQIAEKLWRATEIATDSLLSDEERLRGLSIAEVKHLVGLTSEDADLQAKFSSQAKTLDKLAEHVSRQLETKRKSARTRRG